MPIKLNGATSGSVELDVPAAVGSDLQLTLPATAGEVVVKEADGSVDLGNVDIDSSGRLLVATSSSRSVGGSIVAKLQTEGTGSGTDTTACSVVQNSNDTTGPRFMMAKSRGTSNGSSTLVQDGDQLGVIDFAGADGTDTSSSAVRITAHVDSAPGSNDMPGRLNISTTADGASAPTNRMQIDRRGQALFLSDGTPSVDNMFSTVAGSDSNAKVVSFRRTATSGTPGTGTEICVIRRNGDVDNTNNSYGSISDVKLKENIIDANSQWDDLKALQVRNYNFKVETGHATHTQLGLIAQEVELVSPGLVKTTPDLDDDDNDLGTTTKSVNYSVLYMKAVKALQEAMTRIETLEAKVAALEATP